MKKYWKYVLVCLLAYSVFMLVLTPASWWLRLVPLPANVQLGTVTGTLWRGEVQGIAYQNLVLPTLEWQLAPWSLFTLRAKVSFQAGSVQQEQQPYMQGTLIAGFSGMQLQQSLFKMPVATVVPMLQLPLPVQATGNLLLQIDQLNLKQGACQQLQGQASWLDAKLQPPTGQWLDLQQLHADLSCEQDLPVLVTDANNVLSLDIRASIKPSGRLTVQGSLKPSADLPEEVHQAMRFVGQPDANGRYSLNF